MSLVTLSNYDSIPKFMIDHDPNQSFTSLMGTLGLMSLQRALIEPGKERHVMSLWPHRLTHLPECLNGQYYTSVTEPVPYGTSPLLNENPFEIPTWVEPPGRPLFVVILSPMSERIPHASVRMNRPENPSEGVVLYPYHCAAVEMRP